MSDASLAALEVRSIVDACSLVDALGGRATGELVVHGGEGATGTVFVERGRVCWAAARGLARRLSELLEARASISAHAMEARYAWCKANRVPLGEHLVAARILSAADLREALLTHTVESLLCLCRGDARARFLPRDGEGYNPRFTFATAELVTRGLAVANSERAARLKQLLDELFFDEPWGAAFVRSPRVAYPEPVALSGLETLAASTLLRFGKWAASVVDIVSAFTEPSALLSVTRRSSMLLAFRHEEAIVVGETGAHGPARILNRRARERAQRGRNHAGL
ncbi:MAG: hypothetical protein JST00_16915 [Deltaproteobacteria bacterium]|nr:hypothetical protein [Deltaproteobacteria bacterium]